MLNIARKGWSGVGFETSYGVPAVIAAYYPHNNNTLHGVQAPIANTAAYGVRDQQMGSVQGQKHSEGDFEVNVDGALFPYLAGGAFGTINSANVAGSVYDHTITRNNSNTPKSLTFTQDRGGIDREFFPGVAVSNLEMGVTDGLATAKAGLMGKFPITTTSGTLTTASGGLFSFGDAFFGVGATVAGALAGTNLKPSDLKITVNNNTKPVWRHGSNDVDTVNHGEFMVEGEATIYFESTTDRDRYYNNAKTAAVFKLQGRGIGGGYYDTVTTNLYQVRSDSFELETGLPEFYAEKLKFVMEYDFGNTATAGMVIRNNTASY